MTPNLDVSEVCANLYWIMSNYLEDDFLCAAEVMHKSHASLCCSFSDWKDIGAFMSTVSLVFWKIFYFCLCICACVFTAHVHPHENPSIQFYFWSWLRRAQEVLWGSPAGRWKNMLWVQKYCQLHPNMRRQPHSGWERLTLNKHRLFMRSFVSTHQLTCTAWKERFDLVI